MSFDPLSSASARKTPVNALYVPPDNEEFRRSLEAIDRLFVSIFGSLPDLSHLNRPQYSYSNTAFTEMRTSMKRAPSLEWESDGDDSSEVSEDEIVLSELCALEPLKLTRTTNAPPPELNIVPGSSQGLFPRTSSARLPLSERVQFATPGSGLPVDFLYHLSPPSPVLMPPLPQTPLAGKGPLRPPPIMIPPPAPEKRRVFVARRNPEAEALRHVNEVPVTPQPREERPGTVLSVLRDLAPPEQTKKQRINEQMVYPE
jgi:hypothetical protein